MTTLLSKGKEHSFEKMERANIRHSKRFWGNIFFSGPFTVFSMSLHVSDVCVLVSRTGTF